MDKRSAIIVALGLVAALVIGGVGFAMGMTGPAPSLASTRDPAPEVRTIRRTITVHRPAASTAAAVGVATSEGMSEGDDHESDDHEGDEGHGDHEGDDHEGDEGHDDHEGDEGHGDHEGDDD